MRRLVAVAAVAALAGCHPKGDQEDQCNDVIAHMRKVTMMPMRDADVAMWMGACMMWKPAVIDCMLATANDADIDRCRTMAK